LNTFIANAVERFVYPLGAFMLLSIVALVFLFKGWRCFGLVLTCYSLIFLWIASTPVFAKFLNWKLTSQLPVSQIKNLPFSDAVVLLGGGFGRSLEALRIYRADKAPYIVVSGGYPWPSATVTEAEQMAGLLMELGVPRSALILETKSQNTRENAVNTVAIFKEKGWRTGLLVTSAGHVPRALAAFEKAGIHLVPAVAERPTRAPKIDSLLDLLPDASSLQWTTSAIREIIGMWIYRYHGWA
jgi:uncharacterized SAM-binding protein YcdF (DUF218 family)